MLNKALSFVAKIAVGKQLAAGLAWVHDKLDGKRSEIVLGVLALVHALKLAGVLDATVAAAVEQALLSVLPVTLADRFSKIAKQADDIAG